MTDAVDASKGVIRIERNNMKCGPQSHDWLDQQYYCAFLDGCATRPFDCDTCGDLPTCGGQMVRRVCSRCGMTEWTYPEKTEHTGKE